LTEFAPAHVYTQQNLAALRRYTRCAEPVLQEMPFMNRDVDFSLFRLQYPICACDLARAQPQRAAVVRGVPVSFCQLLAQMSAEAPVVTIRIEAPLRVLRQASRWRSRILTAIHEVHTDEPQEVFDQTGLIVVDP